MKFMGYTRVSTEEQAASGLSLAYQKEKIIAQCKASDLDLDEIVEDAGKSGRDLKRPGLQRILDLVNLGLIDGVVILKLDRLTRSVKDLGYLLDTFAKKGIALKSVQDSLDTTTASGKLIVHFMGAIAQWEREVIGERTAAALGVKRARGEKTGGSVPYGYTVDGKKMLHEDPREQRAIEIMRVCRENGFALRVIAERLESEGYRTKDGRRHWSAQTIKEILARQDKTHLPG
jgi:DNA invertase Pin-like site-specific DNA recombinase